MRIPLLFLMFSFLHVFASISYSQSVKLDLKLSNVTLEQLFNAIKAQSEFSIVLKSSEVNLKEKVSIQARQQTVEQVLNNALKGRNLSFEIRDKHIIIYKTTEEKNEKEMPLQKKTLKGKVKDEKGEPVIGAAVLEKGSANGTITDVDGNFSLNVSAGAILEVSFIGYTTQIVSVGNNTSLNISLLENSKMLDEVVVQAYGTTTKRKTTSAIVALDVDKTTKIPVQSINDAVAGRLAGIIVTADNGAPGAKSSISIRGGGAPVYVIDNVIRSANDFANLNPTDIEDYSILKDAAATALYGVSGANGVILVTTKRGKEGKVSINYAYNQIFSQPTLYPEKVSSYEQLSALNRLYKDEGKGEYASAADLEKYRTGSDPLHFPNTNWRKLTMNNYAPEMRHDLSLTAGNKSLSYYASLSHYDQNSILKTDNNYNKRTTYRLNTTSEFDNINLTISTGVDGYVEKNSVPVAGFWGIYSHIQNKGTRQLAQNEFGLPTTIPDNPVRELDSQSGYQKGTSTVVNGNLSIEYKAHFLDGLRFKINGVYNTWNSVNKTWNYLAPGYEIGSTTPIYANSPSLSAGRGNGNSLTFQGYVLFNRMFGDHSIDFTGVYEQSKSSSSDLNGSRVNYQLIFDQIIAGPTKDQSIGGGENESARAAYLARLSYVYKSKYSLEVSGRRDGDYLFVPGKQWGNFYAVSAGYTISEEPFMRPVIDNKILDMLKIRGSYGLLGDKSDIEAWKYVSGYNITPIAWIINGNTVQGTSEPNSLPSTNYSWQKIYSRDFAIDFSTLNNRFTGTFDYFYTRRTGFVVSDPRFAQTLGIGLPPINFAEGAVRKEGFDFNLKWRDEYKKDFTYELGFNFTYFNTLTERNTEDEATLKNPYTRGSGIKGSYLQNGYINSGFITNNNELLIGARRISSINVVAGDLRYEDVNGDGQINGDDFRRIGSSTFPRINYGFTMDLGYKGFYLNSVIQGSGNRDRYIGNAIQGQDQINLLAYEFQQDYWRPDNTNALFPRAVTSSSVNGNNNFTASDFWLIKSKYVRLKYFQLGYDFKYSLLKNSPLSTMRVFVSGTNLLTFSNSTKYYIDPESDTNNYGYPIQRTIALGVNIGF